MTYITTRLKKELTIDSIITIHYFEYTKDFSFSGESHDFWEFMYVDQGTVNVYAEERYYALKAGDILFHQPNEFHSMKSGKEAPNLIVASFISPSEVMHDFEKQSFALTREERIIISQLVSQARETFSTPINQPSVEQVQIAGQLEFASEQLILIYLELFLITVKRTHLSNQKNEIPHIRLNASSTLSTASSRLDKIIEYMRLHLYEKVTIKELCREFSLSRATLHNLFHNEKGCGPIEFFNKMKIERAKELIRDGSLNLTEISQLLSYSSPQYFSSQFKEVTSMPPIAYASTVNSITKRTKELTPKRDRPSISSVRN